MGFAYLCLTSAVLLVIAEMKGLRAGVWVFKTVAASSFVALGLARDPTANLYGMLMVSGLAFSALGDVLLIPREKQNLFRLGIASFGLAHVSYVAAFVSASSWSAPLTLAGVASAVAAFLVMSWRRLRPHLSTAERPLVGGYMIIIGAMLATSFAAAMGSASDMVIAAALMFAVSDLFVARDRFVKETPLNALAITPLYFAAQVLFALSV